MQYSQVGQDIFALSVANCKSYIEIGAADPITYSNTLLLEQNGWEGFSLELDNKFKEDWNQKRQNLCVYEDAVNFKYFDIKDIKLEDEEIQMDKDIKNGLYGETV